MPEGVYRYDLRGSDYDPGQPILVEKTVIVNHAASVLMAEELDLGADGRLELGEEGLNFTGGLLTVREFMKEQEEKSNGLIHGDSYNITVEGHIGTWYAIDETEVGGEKFFLLEHEEHGDMAACVAVNEQGKLVQRICGTASMKIFRRPYRNISLKNGICRKKKMWCRRSLKRLRLCRTTAHRTIRMCLFTTSRSAMPKKMNEGGFITAHPIG